MNNLQEILGSIETKIKRLALEKADLEERISQQQELIAKLQNEIATLKSNNIEQKNEIKEQKNINKINNIINNSSDIAECREIINDLLKKINRSIAIVSAKENTDNI
jgi:predicted nuclease with TOPRIM domain